MAPIEIEYGRLIKVKDEETFVHDDSNERIYLSAGEKWKGTYNGIGSGRLKLEVQNSTEDNGGFIKYNFVKSLWKLGKVLFSSGPPDSSGTISVGSKCMVEKRFLNDETEMSVGFKAVHKSE